MRAGMPWMSAPVEKATTRERDEVARLLAQVDRMSARIKRAFLEQVDQAAGRVDLAQVAALLREGRTGDAINLVQRAITTANQSPLGSAVSEAALAAGAEAARRIPAINGMTVAFGPTNPRTIAVLRDYEFGLIREIGQRARQSVAEAIRAGVGAGRNPLDIARDVRQHIGLTAQQTRAVMNYRRALEEGRSDALDRALRDRRFDPSVEVAIRDEVPLAPEKIDAMVERYRQRYLRYRSETIARTEALRAVNAGNTAAWTQAVEQGQLEADEVVRTWVYTHDSRTRDAHRLIPSMNQDGVGLDEPFDSTLGPIMYPGDPSATPDNTVNCRCAAIIRYRPKVAKYDPEGV